MVALDILKYPNKKLKEMSLKIKAVSPTITQLARDMMETMHAGTGIGLAAPQVGELIRLIVVDVPVQDTIDPEKFHPDPLTLVNPEVVSGDGIIRFDEGCLSCPELIVTVDRLDNIQVRYLDIEGKPCSIPAKGLKAVCIQHEIDHLNGILLVDKVSRLERDVYKRKRIRLAEDEKDLVKIL